MHASPVYCLKMAPMRERSYLVRERDLLATTTLVAIKIRSAVEFKEAFDFVLEINKEISVARDLAEIFCDEGR